MSVPCNGIVWNTRCWEKTHNSDSDGCLFSLQPRYHMVSLWAEISAHKIISQRLEECQVCVFLNPVYISGRQTVAICESAHMVLRLKVCLSGIWDLTLNPKTYSALTTRCNRPLSRKWGQGRGHFLHILLVRPHRLLRRASNNSSTHINTFVPLWEVLSGPGPKAGGGVLLNLDCLLLCCGDPDCISTQSILAYWIWVRWQ